MPRICWKASGSERRPPARSGRFERRRGTEVTMRSRRDVEVPNALGLHARAAARFVQMAGRYTAQVRLTREGRTVDGKSLMGILLLAAARGSTITISADGVDEQDVVAALAALVESGFGEGVCGV